MRKIIAALFVAALTAGPGPAFASDKTDVMAVVRQFADAFDAGDAKTALALCAAQSAIIDDFPPYLWQGASGCADWASDFDAYSKKNGITEPGVYVGGPKHLDVIGDRAYVVVPANFTAKQNGKKITERGSIWTVALQRVGDKWRITGWSWSKQ
jgi:ketosteroid isomerase-like protein